MQIVKLLYTRTYLFVQALIEMITGSCTRARRQIFGRPCYLFLTPWGWLGLWTWHHTWRRQWLGWVHYTEWEGDSYTELPPRFTAFVHFFLIIFLFHVIRGFMNWWPCIGVIRGTRRSALATSLNLLMTCAGFLTKVQACMPLFPTMHWHPFSIPLTKCILVAYKSFLLTHWLTEISEIELI